MSENSLREITQQIDHLAESYDIHHSNLAGILNHVKSERDALNQMESELTQSRAENALLVEKLEPVLDTLDALKPLVWDNGMEQPESEFEQAVADLYSDAKKAREALTTLQDQAKE